MPADRNRIIKHIEGGGGWLAPDGRVVTSVAELPSEAEFAGHDEAALENVRQGILARQAALTAELGKVEKQAIEAQKAKERAEGQQPQQAAQAEQAKAEAERARAEAQQAAQAEQAKAEAERARAEAQQAQQAQPQRQQAQPAHEDEGAARRRGR